MHYKMTGIVAGVLLGLTLAVPTAFADDWSDAREELRRAEEELAKDTRQMNEAWSKRDRKGVENERAEIVKDREAVARARAKLDGMRRAGRWGGYDSYDDDWGRYDDWRDDDWRDVDDRRRGEWRDARENLLRAEEELRKDQRQLRQARARNDWRGVENERREIEKDYAAVRRAQQRIEDLRSGHSGHGGHGDRGRHRGWYKHKH